MTHYYSKDKSIGRVPIRGRAWGGREIAGRISCFRAFPSRHQRLRSIFLIAAMCAFAQGPSAAEMTSPGASAIGGDTAAGILAESGFPGGLCVHLGSTDGELEAALAQDGRFLVHGLTLSEEACERSRAAVRAKNLYGIASVERMQSLGVLPYADNLVNVIVVEVADLGNQAPAQDEVLRVLCPNGLALLRKPDGVSRVRKPKPTGMDEWTHQKYDACGTSASRDTTFRTPLELRWVTGPADPGGGRWIWGVVDLGMMRSAGGRLFLLDRFTHDIDLGPPDPGDETYRLAAFDAFNGLPLWSRPQRCCTRPQGSTVATEKYLYVCERNRIVAIDARTGEDAMSFPTKRPLLLGNPWGSPNTFVLSGGVLVVGAEGGVEAYAAGDGKFMWDYDLKPGTVSMILAANGRVFARVRTPDDPTSANRAKTPSGILALDLATGERLWHIDPDPWINQIRSKELKEKALAVKPETEADETAEDADDLASEFEKAAAGIDLKLKRKAVLDTATTETFELRLCADDVLMLHSGTALLVVSQKDGSTLWRRMDFYGGTNRRGYRSWIFPWRGGMNYLHELLDVHTGSVLGNSPYIDRATCKPPVVVGDYALNGGNNFIGPKSEEYLFLGARGICGRGWTPANGMIYGVPQKCHCLSTMIYGYTGFGPSGPEPTAEDHARKRPRESGPAREGAGVAVSRGAHEWPTLLHDSARSGATAAAPPGTLAVAWERQVDVPPPTNLVATAAIARFASGFGPPVVAGGLALVSDSERHAIVALSETNGATAWRYTAGGRADLPPTVEGDRCVFGCRDGWVYCLSMGDGRLLWRSRAAPLDRRIVDHGRLESLWPVPGSVCIRDGMVYANAGRQVTFGGIAMCAFRLADGETDRSWRAVCAASYVHNDVLVADGDRFFVGGYELVSESIGKKSGGAPKPASVLSTPSFGLNNAILPLISFSTRYGEWTKCGLQGVSGNILVHDKKRICSIRQGAGKQPSELQVFARSQDGTVGQTPVWRDNSGDAGRIRAMAIAGDALVVACRGEAGTSGLLRIRSLADGAPRGELVLPAAPVLHGLAVVDGGIVVVMDGYRVLKVGAR